MAGLRGALVGLLLVLAAGVLPARAQEAVSFDRGVLVIETAAGQRHHFEVEIAATPAQRGRGLMFRESMPADAGMLFLYSVEQPIRMWMKNTLLPLDMLFVAGDGRIVNIAENTTPLSEKVVGSGAPALGVIELNGGTARRLGIAPGDRVRHAAFTGD
jgi:uncharacterized membrane protein (UPF0127 family)